MLLNAFVQITANYDTMDDEDYIFFIHIATLPQYSVALLDKRLHSGVCQKIGLSIGAEWRPLSPSPSEIIQ